MMVDAVYPWLEKYANKQASYTLVKQKIELELVAMGVTFRADLWGDILEQISMSPTGWQDIIRKPMMLRSDFIYNYLFLSMKQSMSFDIIMLPE